MAPIKYAALIKSMAAVMAGENRVGWCFKVRSAWVMPLHYWEGRDELTIKSGSNSQMVKVGEISVYSKERVLNRHNLFQVDLCQVKCSLQGISGLTLASAGPFLAAHPHNSGSFLIVNPENVGVGINAGFDAASHRITCAAHTVAGDCGSLYVGKTAQGVDAVFGFHVEGSPNGTSSFGMGLNDLTLRFLNSDPATSPQSGRGGARRMD
jgi:hypothetical protein